jgi:hypothetical protein
VAPARDAPRPAQRRLRRARHRRHITDFALAHPVQRSAAKEKYMRKLTLVSGLAFVGILVGVAGSAAADPSRCTVTKIKDQDVSIDIPVTTTIGPHLFCQTGAQKAAKQYALEHRVCDPKNAREGTFSVKVVWHVNKTDTAYEVKAYCPNPRVRL